MGAKGETCAAALLLLVTGSLASLLLAGSKVCTRPFSIIARGGLQRGKGKGWSWEKCMPRQMAPAQKGRASQLKQPARPRPLLSGGRLGRTCPSTSGRGSGIIIYV